MKLTTKQLTLCASSEEIPLRSVPAWRRGLCPLRFLLLSPRDPLRWVRAGAPKGDIP